MSQEKHINPLPDPSRLDSIPLESLEAMVKRYLEYCLTNRNASDNHDAREREELRKLAGLYNVKTARVLMLRHVTLFPVRGSNTILKGSLEKIKALIYHLQAISGAIDWKYQNTQHVKIMNFKKHIDVVVDVLQAAVRIDPHTSQLLNSDGVIFA
jgi:hypothetical protein